MNIGEKNMNKTICDRRTYLQPRIEIIKMSTNAGMMDTVTIERKNENTDEAYGKQVECDMDVWDDGQ